MAIKKKQASKPARPKGGKANQPTKKTVAKKTATKKPIKKMTQKPTPKKAAKPAAKSTTPKPCQ